jgi:hypothetical protein
MEWSNLSVTPRELRSHKMGTVYLSSALVVALALSLCGLEALWEAVGSNRMVCDYLRSLLMALGLTIGLPWLIVKRGEKGMSKA